MIGIASYLNQFKKRDDKSYCKINLKVTYHYIAEGYVLFHIGTADIYFLLIKDKKVK